MKNEILEIFKALNSVVETENKLRQSNGSRLISKGRIEILGQTSLLLQPELTMNLSLAQTGDLDAFLRVDYFVKKSLKEILPKYGFIYDEDSHLVFIPEGSRFALLINLSCIEVYMIDPESALVSKAVKAPGKNLQLIRQVIASEQFPNLVDRIIRSGGDLKKFI